ncbi:prevent-host-death family protein [Streptomyces massasporeus]|uniref:prevent-host-death family protein n=1 Tax=Streptomyces massasporeus TaxID=67324 RepID=UPI003808F81B
MDPNVEDQPIAIARANISKLHNAVQLLRRVYFLTSRGTREAAVVPVDLGELVKDVGGVDAAVAILKATKENR